MIEFLSQPWPWYVAGPMITLTMFLLLFFGRQFGVSSTLRTMCAIGGAGRVAGFFKFN
ncbi:MAG: YeeE/YedE family protein, partial [Bacteroidota bacterium]